MKQHLRNLVSPPMAVAMLALVVAMGGTSYAVASLARNSVGSPQLKAGARWAAVTVGARSALPIVPFSTLLELTALSAMSLVLTGAASPTFAT